MTKRRMDMHRLQDLVRLHRMGTECREVARLLRMSPNTERAYRNALNSAGLLEGDPEDLPELEALKEAVNEHRPTKKPPQQVSSITEWQSEIDKMFKKGATPKAIFDCLRLRHTDFEGSYSAVKRMVRRLKKEVGVRPEDVAIPVETEPGEVAQVDFGYVGKLYDPEQGKRRKAWVFVMVLG